MSSGKNVAKDFQIQQYSAMVNCSSCGDSLTFWFAVEAKSI